MKKSKYAEEFDRMKDLLIRLATEKDENGHLKYNTPELMKLAGFGSDPKVIDAFNRWLNRHGIYRKPRTVKATPAPPEPPTPASEELFPSEHDLDAETLRAVHRKMFDQLSALCNIYSAFEDAIQSLGVEYRRMAVALDLVAFPRTPENINRYIEGKTALDV